MWLRGTQIHSRMRRRSCAHSDSYNTLLSLKEGQWEVDTVEKLPEGVQPQITVEELLLCEKVIREDKVVQKLAADVGKCDQTYVDEHTDSRVCKV